MLPHLFPTLLWPVAFQLVPEKVVKSDKVTSCGREVRTMERSAYSTGNVSGSKGSSQQLV